MPEEYDDKFKDASSIPNTSNSVIERYKLLAPVYNKATKAWGYKCHVVAAQILKKYVDVNRFILDAGCGTGLTGNELYKLGYRSIFGIDISKCALNEAKKFNVYNELIEHDLLKLPIPFKNDRFDALECIGVLTFISDPKLLIPEFVRIVKPNGIIILSQRDDLMVKFGYDKYINSKKLRSIVEVLEITSPEPYQPKNKYYGDKIGVQYIVMKVRQSEYLYRSH